MVIFFTGTGNSRYVAEGIALLTNDKLVSANEFIKATKTASFTSEAPYVFVSPTYAWRIPQIFLDFIESGTFSGNSSAYFLMTCGDDIGSAGEFLTELCGKKNLDFKGVAKVLMPENYVAMYDVPNKAESEQIIADADRTIKTISELIKSGRALPFEKKSSFANLKSRQINPIFYSLFVKAKGFRVTDKCIGCGKCEELCPLNNIKLSDGKPIYGKDCTHCMACICGCPTEAIEYKKKTVGKLRYYNSKSPQLDAKN